jgi:PAS domain S-box-containing protein
VKHKKLIVQEEEVIATEEYARSLIEASHDPLFAISNAGLITDVNNASTIITAIKKDKLIGTNFIQYFTEPNKAKQAYKQVFKKGFLKDYPLTIKDGEETPALFNGAVYKNNEGKIIGAVVVARVITEQRRFEKELTTAKNFAENATLIAEDAVKAKQQFLSNMSHEIRTPMNAIIGFTKVLLKTDITTKQNEYLTAIKLSGDALIVLINDILDLAKVDAGKMTFEQTAFKLSNSIAAMLHLFETKIQEKNLQLIKNYDTNIPEVLLGDSVRLHQIMLNLISNAIKFTAEGSITVNIKMIAQNKKNVTIQFSIQDTGIGINEDKLKNIFENFQQATSNTSRLFGGTGLGLAIVKKLVEAQGGTIKVESKLNEGATFSFCLQFDKTSNAVEVADMYLDTLSIKNKIKVLVAEDMPLNQLLIKTLLDEFGFEVDIVANGKLAVDKLKTNVYDIVLMDLQMPEMNGFEATEYIRNNLKLPIPIIALTADVTTVDVNKCKAVGMNDYLSKPIDERVLFSKIISLLKTNENEIIQKTFTQKNSLIKYTNLNKLHQLTKSDKKLMIEMITVYLAQTPPLILEIKKSATEKNWVMLDAAIHKILPSFFIMGIDSEYETIAKKIQAYANAKKDENNISELTQKIEDVCNTACMELTIELNNFKTNTHD